MCSSDLGGRRKVACSVRTFPCGSLRDAAGSAAKLLIMSKKISFSLVPCFVFVTALSAFGQQSAPRSTTETVNPGSQAGAPGAPDGPRAFRLTTSTTPDTPESTAHKQAAMKLAGSDPVLNKAYGFFCTPTRYNDPAAALEPTKIFDNLYAIPSSREIGRAHV